MRFLKVDGKPVTVSDSKLVRISGCMQLEIPTASETDPEHSCDVFWSDASNYVVFPIKISQ